MTIIIYKLSYEIRGLPLYKQDQVLLLLSIILISLILNPDYSLERLTTLGQSCIQNQERHQIVQPMFQQRPNKNEVGFINYMASELKVVHLPKML